MTFEGWGKLEIWGAPREQDLDTMYADWEAERQRLIEALEAIRDQTGEPETKDIARAVLEEVRHKEGEYDQS